MLEISELTMRGTPSMPSGLTPTPVIDSALAKLTDPSTEGFLGVIQNLALAIDLKDVAQGLMRGNLAEIGKGLIGMADEAEKLIAQRFASEAPELEIGESVAMSM